MNTLICPKCKSEHIVKSGLVKGRQRFRCKDCSYYFSVFKDGKNIDIYYVIKALQLYIEGVSLREIERLIGVSHVSVMNWIKKYNVKAPENMEYRPTYKVLKHEELTEFLANRDNLKNSGMIITELGDKYMLIKWERLKSNRMN
ncbi:MAG: IS1 family transposase [Bacteroidia bacterium]|nr:IS1 family transposase [Bacteroidia bacterium]